MEGFYYDPKHGHCLRRVVKLSPTHYRILGVYGNDEGVASGGTWTAIATRVSPATYSVNFAGKPTKRDQIMTVRQRGKDLHWSDRNVWRRLFVHSSQLNQNGSL